MQMNSLRRKLAIATWIAPREGNIYGKLTVDVTNALEYIAWKREKTGQKITIRDDSPVEAPDDDGWRKPSPHEIGRRDLDEPCDRCRSTVGVEVKISHGRTRLDCARCGRFQDFPVWFDA